MTDVTNTRLAVLAQSLAYVIDADNQTTFEEKASMVTVLGKHVARGEISQQQLHELANDAFNRAGSQPVEKFLDEAAATLTPAQKLSIIINLYDAMLVDGLVVAGERKIMDQFVVAFDIGRTTMRAIREISMLKNDTGLFVDPGHPFNEPDYHLDIEMYGVGDGDRPPVLSYDPADQK